jgi:hypothetical protein
MEAQKVPNITDLLYVAWIKYYIKIKNARGIYSVSAPFKHGSIFNQPMKRESILHEKDFRATKSLSVSQEPFKQL